MSSTIRTVRRNSREARDMWDKATRAVSYTLANYFHGEEVNVLGALEWYRRMEQIKPKITHDGNCYTIHYHSNHWTDIYADV